MTVYEESLWAVLATTEGKLDRARSALEPHEVTAVIEHQIAFIKGLIAEVGNAC